MAEFITSGSQYHGQEAIGTIVRPSMTANLPKGLRVIETKGAGSVKKTYLGPAAHNVVAYSDDFQGGVAADRIQKIFNLGEFKSENQWSKQDFKDEVLREMSDIKGSFQNDFFKSELMQKLPKPIIQQIEGMSSEDAILWVALWRLEQRGIGIGIFNIFWLADTAKLTEAAGTFPNQATYLKYDADIRFNAVNGAWRNIMDIANTLPTINQVKKINMNNSAVAQVQTITVTGTSGTATVTARGLAKLATFDTDLTTTAANFVTAWAASFAAIGLTLTSSTADLIFTDAKKGVGFDVATIVNVSGNLAGSVVATTPNTVASAMAADEALGKLKAMYDGQSDVMKEVEDSKKVFHVTRSFYENYRDTLGTSGSGINTLQSSKDAVIKGLAELTYLGIPLEKMTIDSAISSYFGGYSPHRAILTVNDNLSLIVSGNNEFAEATRWWNKDANKVRTRTQFEMGGDFFMPELMVVAYQG